MMMIIIIIIIIIIIAVTLSALNSTDAICIVSITQGMLDHNCDIHLCLRCVLNCVNNISKIQRKYELIKRLSAKML